MDHTHGCYGATSALLAAADWVAGPRWDGGLALVVGADVAVYPAGSPARPTGEGRAGVFASVGVLIVLCMPAAGQTTCGVVLDGG